MPHIDLTAGTGCERVARLVLVACEAFDNMPPGPAQAISRVAAVPGDVWLLLQLLRVRAIRRLAGVDLPALIVWANDDRLMPREHGPRLAALLPNSRLAEIADSSTLVPEDQPEELARLLSDFTQSTQ